MTLTLLACNGNDAPKPWPNTPTAPLISTLSPVEGATGVALNAKPSAVFNMAMTPLTGTTFTLVQGTTQVAGSVTNSADGLTATFAPASPLAPSSVFTATITTGAMSSAGANIAANRSWSFTTIAAVVDTTPPTVSATIPAANATGVSVNANLTATFSEPITAATITPATFILMQGTTPVLGTVAYAASTATFAPTSPLALNTLYKATLTTNIKDLAGNALVTAYTWSFTTALILDTTPPTVSSTIPGANSTGVGANTGIVAIFNEAINPLTITATTFTVMQGTTPVLGTLAMGSGGTTATFTPTALLVANTLYTVTLTSGVKDLAGNGLASAFVWSFTTGATTPKGPAVVNLGTAGNFAILAKTQITTVPDSKVTGDIGLSPAAATYLQGFSLTADSTNVFATSTQIVGKAFASNYAVPTPANLTTAVGNMQTAYSDAAGRPTPDHLELGTGNIGGLTLAPGLYKWTSTVTIPTDVTISGGANDVWIFQTSGDLTMSPAKSIILAGGAQAKNIFWQVAGQVTIGTGAHFEGILLCQTQVTLQTSATMNGRILAQTMVALQKATVTVPAP